MNETIINQNSVNVKAVPGTSPKARRDLLAAGYPVLPILGKFPRWSGWPDVEITPDLLSRIEADHPDHLGTGIRCGELSVADIDLTDSDHAAQASKVVQLALGENAFERVGAKGLALFYFNAAPVRKITVSGTPPGGGDPQRVEFLGIGQQVATFGRHPNGKPYKWPRSKLSGVRLDQLPEVTPADLDRAAGAVRDLLEELDYSKITITGTGQREAGNGQDHTGDPVTPAMLESMLAHIDPAECQISGDWIAYMCAIKYGRLYDLETMEPAEDFDRFDLFLRWSAGELADDHEPGNFKDAADCQKHWDSKGSRDKRGDGAGLGSIIKAACEAGYEGDYRVSAMERFRAAKGANGAGPAVEAPVDTPTPLVEQSKPSDHLFDVRAFLKRGKRREFVIPDWLPAKGITGVLAKRNTGKSLVLTDLAARIATDSGWQGLPIHKEFKTAVYLCGEDDDGLEMNLAAWEQDTGKTIPTGRLIVSDKILQLKNPEEVAAWIDAIREWIGDRRAVTILDTWQRATSTTKGQSNDEEMAPCVENAERLADALNGPLIFAAHPPKSVKVEDDLSVMGSSVIENAAVALWTLWEKTDGLDLRTIKVRGAASGSWRRFRLRVVELKGRKNVFGVRDCGAVVEAFAGVTENRETALERERVTLEAWSIMVRLALEAGGYKGADKQVEATRRGVSEWIAGVASDKESRWHSQIMEAARPAGIISFGERTIRAALTSVYFPDKGAAPFYDFLDGGRLVVAADKRRFRLVDPKVEKAVANAIARVKRK